MFSCKSKCPRYCSLIHTRAVYTVPNCILSVAYQNFYSITPIVSLAFRLLVYHLIISASRGRVRFTERQLIVEADRFSILSAAKLASRRWKTLTLYDRAEVTRYVLETNVPMNTFHVRSVRLH